MAVWFLPFRLTPMQSPLRIGFRWFQQPFIRYPLLGCMGPYWVTSFTLFDWVFNWFHRVLLADACFYRFFRVSLDSIRLNWALFASNVGAARRGQHPMRQTKTSVTRSLEWLPFGSPFAFVCVCVCVCVRVCVCDCRGEFLPKNVVKWGRFSPGVPFLWSKRKKGVETPHFHRIRWRRVKAPPRPIPKRVKRPTLDLRKTL